MSRALSGHPRVREETRRRIVEVAASLGYVRNAAARSLISRRSNLLGLLIANLADAFAPEMIEGVTDAAVSAGYTVIVGCVQERADRQAEYLRLMAEHQVAGTILASGMLGSAADIQPLVRRDKPIVLAGRAIDGLDVDTIAVDNQTASITATSHVLEHGRRRVAFVGGLAGTSTTRDRIRGYTEALRSADLEIDPSLIVPGEFSRHHGYQATVTLLQRGSVDAIVAADDTIALGCLDAAADLGMAVPEQLSVVGFGDQPAASIRAVSLSTIRASGYEMGALAVRLLLERLASAQALDPRHVTLEHELILRRSCGPHA